MEKIMQDLAEKTGLTFDGGDDNRLFDQMFHADTLSMSKKEYNAMEKDLAKFEVKGKGFTVSAWNDSSGYNYWTLGEQEDNYIQITVYIQHRNVTANQIKKAVQEVRNHFAKYEKVY